MKKLTIAILAHPDDESFGIGGTLALRALDGEEVHVLLATRGEAGGEHGIEKTREKETKEAAKALGIKNHHFLGFKDGELCNKSYGDILAKVDEKIRDIINKREVDVDFITFDRLGISGHIDHITMSMITTCAFRRLTPKLASIKNSRLLYFVLSKDMQPAPNDDYFVYGPAGTDVSDVDEVVDVSPVIDKKISAIRAHASQSPENILSFGRLLETEHFVLYKGD